MKFSPLQVDVFKSMPITVSFLNTTCKTYYKIEIKNASLSHVQHKIHPHKTMNHLLSFFIPLLLASGSISPNPGLFFLLLDTGHFTGLQANHPSL